MVAASIPAKRKLPHSPEQWLQLAIRYLARFDRSAAQVERFLTAKGATPAQVNRVLSRLRDLRYLDDGAYAQRWIESRLARRPMGRERVRAELLTRGIEESIIEKAVHEAFREMDEEAFACLVLRSKQRGDRSFSTPRTVRLLRQRGFGEDTISRIIGRNRDGEGEGSDS